MVTETTGTLLIEEADENGNILAPSSSQLSETLDGLAVSYTYDLFNRLISTKTGKKTVSFDYEADGYRHSKSTVSPSSEENIIYFYEGDHVVFEADETGKVTAVNHFGTSRYARTIYEGEEETTFYYQFNAYGDVTALIGTDGNTIAKYEYDAFGNLTSQPDVKVNNSITYRGYEYDSETGLYYLNARYYDSETARFLTEDTYRGEKNDPLSLNLYTYCKNNPLKYTDPTGHSSVDFGYVSGSYELSEEAKKQKEARERQLEDDILALLRGGGAVFIGITVMAATGGMATPVVIWLALTLGGTATAFGLSDITQGVDGIYKHSTSDGVYYSINPIRDEFFNGDDYAYESTEMFVIQAASFTGTNGEAFADWLKSSVKYVSNKISTFLKSPFTPKGSGDPTLLYGTEIPESGSGTVNPKDVKYMQSSIKNQTGDYTVLDNAQALKDGTLKPSDLPEMRIWKDNEGNLWTLDHRRLAAFRMAGVNEVPFRWATDEEVASQMWKMTTQSGGTSIRLNLGNGKSITID